MTVLDDLDESQKTRMLWATDPTYGGRVKLSATDELVRDFREWLTLDCQHLDRGIVCVRASNGAPMYRQQCYHCGQAFGQWISKASISDAANIPEVSANRLNEYNELGLAAWQQVQAQHAEKQLSDGENEYARYLQSELWKKKRAKVIKRADGICEGCGENAATQVHHLTYRHVQEEFLWELVAICDECHDRAHPEDQE